MKILLGIVLLVLLPFRGFSQESDTETIDEEVFTIVELMPEFPGGKKALFKFLANNIYYPPEAKAKNIQGKVFINFTVGKDGGIGKTKILRGVHPSLDKEAVRVINSMPNWTPGEQRGIPVAVSYNMPIVFKFGVENLLIPTEAEKQYNLGTNYLGKLEIKKAILSFSSAILNDPNYIDAYYNRGICYYKNNENEKACADWRKSVELGDEEAKNLLEKYCNKK